MRKWNIEVGACDFDNIQPDERYNTLYVEPAHPYFINLRNKYEGCENVFFCDHAVSDKIGFTDITYILPNTVSEDWVRGISSIEGGSNLIQRNQQLGYKIGDPVTVRVVTLTLDELLAMYEVSEIEILKMDVEGMELKILENYSWNVLPEYFKIEHKFVDLNRLLELLKGKGYECWHDSEDVFAYLK